MKQHDKDQALSAAITFLIVLGVLLALFFGGISIDKSALAQASIPEISPDEELFLEPELIDLGEETSLTNQEPAPAMKGEPVKAQEENAEIVEPSPEPTPAPKPARNEIAQKKESKIKQEKAAKQDKERKQASSKVANKFSSKNGSTEGTDAGATGAGGPGIGISGNAHGRTFISCPKPDVSLRHKTVVKVLVVIDAQGNVKEASATGSADASIRRKCEQAARQAKWSPKKGASSTRGSITFTITPR